SATPRAIAHVDHDPVAGVDVLVGEDLDRFPLALPALPDAQDGIRVAGGQLLPDLIVNLRGEVPQGRIEIPIPIRLRESADDLHVLLRHRARSISRVARRSPSTALAAVARSPRDEPAAAPQSPLHWSTLRPPTTFGEPPESPNWGAGSLRWQTRSPPITFVTYSFASGSLRTLSERWTEPRTRLRMKPSQVPS